MELKIKYFQDSVSIQRAARATVAESRIDGWIQFGEGELEQRKDFGQRNATWQMMQLSCPSPNSSLTHLVNTHTTTSTTPTRTTTLRTAMNQKLIKSIFIPPPYREINGQVNSQANSVHGFVGDCEQDFCGSESQTLQLFPLRSGNGNEILGEEESEISVSAMNDAAAATPSHQFFEFLPLKN